MKILLASSELHPYSKTGGLADMVGAMAKYLARAGEDVSVITPLYRDPSKKLPRLKSIDGPKEITLGTGRVRVVFRRSEPEPGLTIYFVDYPPFFERAGLYGEKGMDYPDNAARFILFSKCVAYLARHLIHPEIIHAHDWQSGLAPLLVQHQKGYDRWDDAPATCFTIHNLAFQGNFPIDTYRLTNLPWDYLRPEGAEFYGKFSLLKTALFYADFLTTVSPKYAQEITTQEFGCGMDGILRARRNSLVGILNGVDYTEWDPAHDPELKHPYNPDNLEGKDAEKLELQRTFGLAKSADVPLFGTISRLTEQKGIDIQLGALEEMLASPMQFVLLGNGDARFERGFQELTKRFPEKAAARIGFDPKLAHQIEAGIDFFLMPSRFEPCGLNQLYSLRYGSVPIVRATGGLDDSVRDAREDPEAANGIKFEEYSAGALAKAMRKALVLYEHKELLRHYRLNGMESDFSWERTAREYLRLYEGVGRGDWTGTTPMVSRSDR